MPLKFDPNFLFGLCQPGASSSYGCVANALYGIILKNHFYFVYFKFRLSVLLNLALDNNALIVFMQLKAVMDMNQRDFQSQQEQEERRVSVS